MRSEGDAAGEAWAIPVEELRGGREPAQLRYARRPKEAGWICGELVAGVVAVGLLAVLVVPSFMGSSTCTHSGSAQSQVNSLRSQVELFRMHCGDYPPNLDALLDPNAANNPIGWAGPYLPGEMVPLDAWHRAIKYQRFVKGGAKILRLSSAGPDGLFGDADDLVCEWADELGKPFEKPGN